MKTLVVGGAGMIGGHAALHLQSKGHEVTIAGRNAPEAGTPLGALPFERIDYIGMAFDRAALGRFDNLVFAAGNDVRHAPAEAGYAHWREVNTIAVPRFFAAAKDAGIRTAINIGSFYPQAAPELVEGNGYIRSRKESDAGVVALSDGGFRAMSINAPYVLGAVPGLKTMFKAYVQWAEGIIPLPAVVAPGGVNFISCQSLSEACEGGIARGEGGASYLVGDENLSWQDYFALFFAGFGKPAPEVRDEEMPMMPDPAIFWGRGNTLYYEPDAAVVARLGYRRGDIARAVAEIVAQFRSA